jgi:hypothetical protein
MRHITPFARARPRQIWYAAIVAAESALWATRLRRDIAARRPPSFAVGDGAGRDPSPHRREASQLVLRRLADVAQLHQRGKLRRRDAMKPAKLGDKDRAGALMGAAQEMPDLLFQNIIIACSRDGASDHRTQPLLHRVTSPRQSRATRWRRSMGSRDMAARCRGLCRRAGHLAIRPTDLPADEHHQTERFPLAVRAGALFGNMQWGVASNEIGRDHCHQNHEQHQT